MITAIIIFGLIILVLFVSIGTMLSKYKPYGIATISAGLSAIWTWIIETKTNFSVYILTPALETLEGIRPWDDLYNLGTVFMFFGLLAIVIVAFFNIILTWEADRPFSLWR